MTDYYVGEIRMMANASGREPVNFVHCNGQLLNVRDYEVLFSLIGNTYGGDGISTFAVPDLRGRLPIGQGAVPGLTARTIGQSVGTETVSLTAANLPPHNHPLRTSGQAATTQTAGQTVTFANTAQPTIQYLKDGLGTAGGTVVSLADSTVGATGEGLPHDNVMPCATINFIICFKGLYPVKP